MRDVDLETLLAQEVSPPNPMRRQTARALALQTFERTHRRGIGATVARYLVRSSAPAWHLIADTLESPWTTTIVRLATSLLALIVFTGALLAALMLAG